LNRRQLANSDILPEPRAYASISTKSFGLIPDLRMSVLGTILGPSNGREEMNGLVNHYYGHDYAYFSVFWR
jgi:hypothetical protein